MGEINGYITEILQRLSDSGLLWFTVSVCAIVLFLLLWLIARRVRLWYWKVGAQVDTLKSIDKKIELLGEGLAANTARAGRHGLSEDIEKIVAEIEELETMITEKTFQEQEITTIGQSKTRKIYTEQELDELIKD